MKILFLVPYPLTESPSQRFRFEQYFEHLHAAGHFYQTQSFLNAANWRYFYSSGNLVRKALALLNGFVKRFIILFQVSSFDFVFIHREATPVGPPVFEWIIARLLRKKIIYDFDDAIWLTDRPNESLLFRVVKWRKKVSSICGWSYKVSAGNAYLCNYAKDYAPCVIYNPTTIDTLHLHNPALYTPKKEKDKITIGWTGSHSTLKYLDSIIPSLQELELKYPSLQFLVIANQKPNLPLRSMFFLPWTLENEMTDLQRMDIGVMPLPDDEWANGKCGFKALQYMAMEIATVASPVGVNKTIIQNGVNGFICSSQKEWTLRLTELIESEKLRVEMGQKGRKKIVDHYSVESNRANFLSLFEYS